MVSIMKKIIVLTFGTFDLFHLGHERYLQEAKKHGDLLYVVVARDTTVKVIKGRSPIDNEEQRLKTVKDLPYVDAAYLGSEGDKYAIVEELKLDVLCFGYDQTAFIENIKDTLARRGLYPKIFKFTEGYNINKYKTSKIREQKE